MTTLTIAARPAARTVRSELTKIRSVRSTYWTLFVLVLASVAWCVAYCLGTVHQWPTMSAQDRAGGQIPHTFPAWGELAVFAGYAAILLLLGAVQFARRDA